MMSSNHLNYELSKQLKELGVGFLDEELWTSQLDEQSLVHSSGRLSESCICHPTTAQLIDELRNRLTKLQHVRIQVDYDLIQVLTISVHEDPCCTTALGKALIELVVQEKEDGSDIADIEARKDEPTISLEELLKNEAAERSEDKKEGVE